MKRRIIAVLLAAMAALAVGACGKEEAQSRRDSQGQPVAERGREEAAERDGTAGIDRGETAERNGTAERDRGETAEKDGETEEKDKETQRGGEKDWEGGGAAKGEKGGGESRRLSSDVRLGGDFDEKYAGFSYLQCETLTLIPDEYNGRTTEKELKIFLPAGNYTSVNENYGYADSMGVDFRVSFDPYLPVGSAGTLEELLAAYMDAAYDVFYNDDAYALELSEIETTENGVRSVAKYCYYDEWMDSYMPVYCTYYLTQADGENVLVEVEINLMDVSGNMEGMLAEIEAFYGFDIAWDAEEAQKKLDDFIAAGIPDTVKIATGYLAIEVPKGWGRDFGYDYNVYAFAPDGSVSDAGCVVSITHEYMWDEKLDVTEVFSGQEAIEQYMEGFAAEANHNVEDMELEFYGSTCMGEAVKFSYKERDGGVEIFSVMFLITNEDYFSVVYVTAYPDRFEEALAVAENILANGRMRQ